MSCEYKQIAGGPLMAVDDLGRVTPVRADGLSSPRENRQVGMFYFLWLGTDGADHPPYDVSKIVAEDPQAGYHPDSPLWGGVGRYHHWGEPFYGYYHSNDEWVVRRHMKLLMQADIDFLFFDTTNALIYENNAKLVMRVLQEYHDEGWKIPKVMFYTNTASGKTVEQIYKTIYLPEYCKDTWFYFEGKPLIIAIEEECSPEARAFFNIKMSQWPNEPDKQGGWPWMDFTRPQRVFENLQGEEEVINVSVAQHPQLRFGDSVLYGEKGNCGRGFHNGVNDPDPDAYKKGYNFAEQFDRAIETDPPVVLVTGWNEWIAGYWEGIPERPVMFVDCANPEYSRDIEMMRGGYFDNYFMQLVQYVRRYKGVEDTPTYGAGQPAVYENTSDGDFERHAKGYACVYDNHTQRNAIVRTTVWHDTETLHFEITAKAPVTAYDGTGTWMRVYLQTGKKAGYDLILNHTPTSDGTTTVADANGQTAVRTTYRIEGNRLLLQMPLDLVTTHAEDGVNTLWFKVADSREPITSTEDFYDHGDVAPLGRLNYVYTFTV